LFRRLFAAPPKLLTTSLVIAEGHGWFLRRYDRSRALRFLSLVHELTPMSILPTGPGELAVAGTLLRRFPEQYLTLADAVGLHVVQSMRIKTCWSTDRHLRLTGAALAID
jgi:hypothetical protein